jgi:hypothetical protein
MPDYSGEPVVTTRVLSTFAHEAAGALGIRHSLLPPGVALRPLFWANDFQNSGISRRESVKPRQIVIAVRLSEFVLIRLLAKFVI